MTVKGLLLAGVSVCAVGMGSAFAAAPQVHVTALRPGHALVKTALHGSPDAANQTVTYSVSTGISTATAYKVKTNLLGTFYTLNDSGGVCSPAAKQKVTLSTKKTKYARLSTGSVTANEGCATPTTFRGTVYDLIKKNAADKTDTFVNTLTGKVKNNGTYTVVLNLDTTVAISK